MSWHANAANLVEEASPSELQAPSPAFPAAIFLSITRRKNEGRQGLGVTGILTAGGQFATTVGGAEARLGWAPGVDFCKQEEVEDGAV